MFGDSNAINYSTAFSGIASEATNAISAVLPVVVPVLAIIIGIGIALKIVRKVTGR